MTKNEGERDSVLESYRKLNQKLAALKADRAEVERVFTRPATATILQKFESEIEQQKEQLVTCDKKEFESRQAHILARRALMATLKGAYEEEIAETVRQIAEFEKANALFITQETRDEIDRMNSDALSA